MMPLRCTGNRLGAPQQESIPLGAFRALPRPKKQSSLEENKVLSGATLRTRRHRRRKQLCFSEAIFQTFEPENTLFF
jgi:hypothetical protein